MCLRAAPTPLPPREPVFAWVSSILRVLNWPQGPHLAGISPVDCFLCLLWFCDVGTPCFFPQGCLPPSLVRSPGVHGKVSCALGVEGTGGAAVLEHHRTVSSSPPADEWFCQVQLASSEVVLFLLSAPSVVSLLRLRPLPGPQIGELNKCPLELEFSSAGLGIDALGCREVPMTLLGSTLPLCFLGPRLDSGCL